MITTMELIVCVKEFIYALHHHCGTGYSGLESLSDSLSVCCHLLLVDHHPLLLGRTILKIERIYLDSFNFQLGKYAPTLITIDPDL